MLNDEMIEQDGYQILVTGITWNTSPIGKFSSKKDFSKNLPDQFAFNLPESFLENKDESDFFDKIETFTYNLLMHRFNHIAHHCQIWLPLENETGN